MSALFDTLSRAFEEGHARDVADLMTDARFADAERTAQAAVLIAVVDRPEEPSMILTQRPNTMRDHPGQVAFPGGKLEEGEDPVTAALREAEEELAIPPGDVRVIGATDLYHTGTGFCVTPVLGMVPPGLAIKPDPREVEDWFEAPLSLVMDRSNWTMRSAMWKGQQRHYLDMEYGGFRIWGVTAAIISNLSRRIEFSALVSPNRSS